MLVRIGMWVEGKVGKWVGGWRRMMREGFGGWESLKGGVKRW